MEGRSKEQINRAGEKIATEEVEQALLTHPQIRLAALVAMPDEVMGEKVVLSWHGNHNPMIQVQFALRC